MKTVTQFSIEGSNKEGVLTGIIQHLAYGGVNILGIIIVDRGEIGTIRLVPNDPVATERIFRETGITYKTVEVLAVRMPDKPGALHQVTKVLAENHVNIDYIYPLVGSMPQPTVIFKTTNLEEAYIAFMNNKIPVQAHEDLMAT